MRIGEINIICTDLPRSRAFYVDLLGLEVLEQEGKEALHLRCGEHLILLLAVASQSIPSTPYCLQPCISFDLIVPELESFAARLGEAGVKIEREYSPDTKNVFVRDPDGLLM